MSTEEGSYCIGCLRYVQTKRLPVHAAVSRAVQKADQFTLYALTEMLFQRMVKDSRDVEDKIKALS